VSSFFEKRAPAFPNQVPADLPADDYPFWDDPEF
jgi:hypothetical protein